MQEGKRRIPSPVIVILAFSLGIILLIVLLQNYPRVTAPIFFAAVTAYLVNPLVNLLERKTRFSRTLITGFTIFLLVALVILLLVFILPYLVEQTQRAAQRIPALMDQATYQLERFNDYLHRTFPDFTKRINLATEMEKGLQSFTDNFSRLMMNLFNHLYDIVLSLLFMILLPLFSFYFIRDARKIRESLLSLIPTIHRESVIQKAREVNRALAHFIRGQVIVIFILVVLYSTGLSLLNIPFALAIGIFAGIGDLVPYFGTITGLVISLVLTLVEFQSIEKMILVLLLFAVVKGSENWYFYPKIVGKEINVHFLWVLVSLIFFGQFFGFWGLVLAIPSATIFKIFLHDAIQYYRHSPAFRENRIDE